jgi:type III secretion protein N (ATPase)
VTAVYTVLVAGGDLEEPIADEVRGILDGHVVLDRALASRGRFPAIEVLQSVSRVMPEVVSDRHRELAGRARRLLAALERQRDLIALGAYRAGSDPEADEALARRDALDRLLAQDAVEATTLAEAVSALEEAVA